MNQFPLREAASGVRLPVGTLLYPAKAKQCPSADKQSAPSDEALPLGSSPVVPVLGMPML